jgi:hypothetical protein
MIRARAIHVELACGWCASQTLFNERVSLEEGGGNHVGFVHFLVRRWLASHPAAAGSVRAVK